MKVKVLLLLFWSSLSVFAQTKPDSLAPFREKADFVLALICGWWPTSHLNCPKQSFIRFYTNLFNPFRVVT